MKYFILPILLFSSVVLSAQTQEPQIFFDLYLTDAIGNKDTISVGYDLEGWPLDDPEFGEVDLSDIPYDSVFEVRGADKSAGDLFQSDIIVTYYDPIWCYDWPWTDYQSFLIYAKHWPVQIEWDQSYFQDTCYEWSHFTRVTDYMEHPNFINGDPVFLRDTNALEVRRDYIQQTHDYHNWQLEPIEGGGQDSVFAIYIGLAGQPHAVGNKERPKELTEVFPNPASDFITIKNIETAVERVEVLLLDGQKTQFNTWENIDGNLQLNIQNLPIGQYYGKVYLKNGKVSYFRFMKM